MKPIQIFLCIFLALLISKVGKSQSKNLSLWYDEPAGDEWVRALPVGNGRLGAMVFGNIQQERIQLNENTIWAGSPYHNNSPDAREALSKIRQLIFEGKHAEAQQLAGETFFSGPYGMPYQPVGDLVLSFPGNENYKETNYITLNAFTDYIRLLRHV